MNAAFFSLGAALAVLAWGLSLLRTAGHRLSQDALGRLRSRTPLPHAALFGAVVATGAAVPPGPLLARLLLPLLSRGTWSPARAAQALLAGEAAGALALVAVVLAAARPEPFQLLTMTGVALLLGWSGTRAAALGKGLLGLALAILSIALLALAGDQAIGAPAVAAVADAASGMRVDRLPLAIAGVLAALLMRSAPAAVLFTAGLLSGNLLPVDAAFALVLGASFGSGLQAVAATHSAMAPARQAALVLLAVKGLVVLPLLAFHERSVSILAAAPGSLAAAAWLAIGHLAITLLASLLALGVATPLARAIAQWRLFDGVRAFRTPAVGAEHAGVALSAGVRDVVRLADRVEVMLRGLLKMFLLPDATVAASMRELEQAIDTDYRALKQRLLALRRDMPQAAPAQRPDRWDVVMGFAITLEQLADAADRVLHDLEKRSPRQCHPPRSAIAEVCGLHAVLMQNLRAAVGLLLNEDAAFARRLVQADAEFSELERLYAAAHLERLATGEPGSLDSSGVHLDLLGDLERMNRLVCALGRYFVPPSGPREGLQAPAQAPA